MESIIEFFVPLKKIPTATHQQKKVNTKNNKPIFYEPDNLKAARVLFMNRFSKFVPDEPLRGPLSLTTKWFYSTESKTRRDGEWKDTRPDTDNLVKLPKDCLTDLGFWEDDGRVASELIQKFWVKDSPSGVYVRIEELT